MATKRKSAIGTNFDDFLAEEGMLDEVNAVAVKRVIAWQIEQTMKAKRVSKKKLAERMHTSRTQLDRLLDANNSGLTLVTLSSVARALGCRVKVELEAA